MQLKVFGGHVGAHVPEMGDRGLDVSSGEAVAGFATPATSVTLWRRYRMALRG